MKTRRQDWLNLAVASVVVVPLGVATGMAGGGWIGVPLYFAFAAFFCLVAAPYVRRLRE